MAKKAYFVDGFQLYQARRVCNYIFGDFMIDIKMVVNPTNINDRRFDVILQREIVIDGKPVKLVDYIDLVDFKKEWPLWRLCHEKLDAV